MPAVKQFVRGLCPPALWSAVRLLVSPLPPLLPRPPGPREVSTVEEIDAEIARAAAAFDRSFRECEAVLSGFRLRYPPMPPDPDSDEYRAAQMRLYAYLSGRPTYDAAACEATPFGDEHAAFPYPYFTRNCREVGQHLVAVGLLIQALDLPAGGRVLEFGCGYGKLTIEMAQLGLDVTAVDIYRPFLDLTERRCGALGRPIRTARADMLDYAPAEPFERVVFNACFHHCGDHRRMVGRLDRLVAPGGAVVFAAEPVWDDFPVPWGLNPNGDALWAIRRHGWLELGFRADYFVNLLGRHGWACEWAARPGLIKGPILVARRR